MLLLEQGTLQTRPPGGRPLACASFRLSRCLSLAAAFVGLLLLPLSGCADSAPADDGTAPQDLPTDSDLPEDTCGSGKIEPNEFCYTRVPTTVDASGVVGDFEGDGLPDIGSLRNEDGKTTFRLWRGDGTGAFVAPTQQVLSAVGHNWIVADLDGAVGDDLVAIDITSGEVNSFLSSAGGSFSPAITSSPTLEGLQWSSTIAFDYDLSGTSDLLIEPEDPSADLLIFIGAGGIFSDALESFSTDPACWAIDWERIPAFGGFGNGVAYLDGICDNQPAQNAITILLPRLDEGVVTSQGATDLPKPEELVSGDFDGDGSPELLVWDSDLQIFARYGIDAQGSIAPDGTYTIDEICSACTVTEPIPRPGSLVGQFGGADADDLFLRIDGVAYFNMDPLSAGKLSFELPEVRGALWIADFNADSLDDVLVDDYVANEITILLSQP